MHSVADDLASWRCSLRQRQESSPVRCCILPYKHHRQGTVEASRGPCSAPQPSACYRILATRISLLASRPQITGRGRPPSSMPYMHPDHTLSNYTLISPTLRLNAEWPLLLCLRAQSPATTRHLQTIYDPILLVSRLLEQSHIYPHDYPLFVRTAHGIHNPTTTPHGCANPDSSAGQPFVLPLPMGFSF